MKTSGILLIIPVLALVLGGCASSPDSPVASESVARQVAEVNTQLGREYMGRGQFEVALEKLRKAVNADPGYAPAHTVLAILYERIGEADQAGRHYRLAVEANPSNGDVNNNYGVFLCQEGKLSQAHRHFRRAMEDPFYRTPAVAYANAGACELRQGDLDKAEGFLRQSLAYNPEFPDALLQLAGISYQKGKFLPARAFLQRYEAVGPASAESLLLGYRIETRLNDPRAAREYAGKLRQRFPDSQQAREIRGESE